MIMNDVNWSLMQGSYEKLIENVLNNSIHELSNDSDFIDRLKNLFSLDGKDDKSEIIPQWLSSMIETYDLSTDNSKIYGKITNGIYYVHSYINTIRLPYYFGSINKDEEDLVNKRLWDVGNSGTDLVYL